MSSPPMGFISILRKSEKKAIEKINPNPDIQKRTLLRTRHCEHLIGAWQSHGINRDRLASLATTISKSGFGIKQWETDGWKTPFTNKYRR